MLPRSVPLTLSPIGTLSPIDTTGLTLSPIGTLCPQVYPIMSIGAHVTAVPNHQAGVGRATVGEGRGE
eukprot:1745407-Rhodomonas_salina.1